MTSIATLSLRDITPPNIAADSEVSSIITALDPELQELSRLSLEPLILSRIDELPEAVIDLLAWQLHVDFYDLAGTLSMKREAVKGSILWHMHKGTEWAILEALTMIDISAEFVHWHDDNGQPYTFKLKAIVSGDFYRTKGKDKLISSIRRAVNEAKAARSFLAELDTRMEFKEDIPLYAATIPLLSGDVRLLLPPPDVPDFTHIFMGLVDAQQGQHVIRLAHEDNLQADFFAANVVVEYRDENLGVDLDTMQELLRQFEKRIFDRLDNTEARLIDMINASHDDTNKKLEEIKNLLLWNSDSDEEIF